MLWLAVGTPHQLLTPILFIDCHFSRGVHKYIETSIEGIYGRDALEMSDAQAI